VIWSVKKIRIGFVDVEPFRHPPSRVLMQRQAAGVIGPLAFDVAGFDLQRVEATVAILGDPFAERVARKGRLGSLRPFTPVGIDAPVGVVDVIDQDVSKSPAWTMISIGS